MARGSRKLIRTGLRRKAFKPSEQWNRVEVKDRGPDKGAQRITVDKIYGIAGTEKVDIEEVEESLGHEETD